MTTKLVMLTKQNEGSVDEAAVSTEPFNMNQIFSVCWVISASRVNAYSWVINVDQVVESIECQRLSSSLYYWVLRYHLSGL